MSSIQQGLILMITGMAVVFSFLVLLIIVTKLLSRIVNQFFPEKETPPRLATEAAHPPVSAAVDNQAEIAAAVAAAYARSR